jgi:hypothetical protein
MTFTIRFAMTLALVIPASAARAACAEGPGRSGYAMTYDGNRAQVVIFGGEAAGGSLTADLLAWDGTRWTCLSSGGPSPRSDAVLAFDGSRKVLVLYGGRAGRQSFRDTWEFAAGQWVRRDTAGPTPEPHGVAAFDHAAGGVLLFSGLGDDTPARGTWLWNGKAWSSRANEPRAEFPDAALDATPGNSARLITARRLGPDRYNPLLYAWSGAWTPLAATGDVPVFSPQAPAAATPKGVLLYAGFEADRSVNTWTFDGSAWTRHGGASPTRRKGAQMALDRARGVVVLFAGDDGDRILTDTWEWDGRAWRRIS